ncbi:tail spike protein [Acinetobacter phage Cato]|nr:tail spike protein [Acinetobacter phage Cato]
MTNPTLITTPFAENGDKNSIPETNTDPNKPQLASMQAGFPPITQQKISEGGIPPERNDFNGILNLYGQHIVHLNKGLPYEFDQAFADAIGGYPLNARLMLDNGDIVQSIIANNVNNPNTDLTGWAKSEKNPLKALKTILDLRNESNPKNNDYCVVLSHSNNDSGPMFFKYDSTSTEIDDDGTVIKPNSESAGRWIAQVISGFITPRNFGAKAKGDVDERLLCEKSIVAAKRLGVKWLVPQNDVYLLNSYASYSDIASFSASMLPLFSNMQYEINGTLKVGSFFDNKDFIVFTDINAASSSDFIPVKNWYIYGNGDIDLSLAGKRIGSFKLRIPIYLETSQDALIKSIKIHDGDTPNAIVTGGKNIIIDGVRFIDLMQDNSSNDDHSTIYAKAESTHIKNCYFEMNTVNGHLNACPVELHNSNSSFTSSVINGYRNTHILAALYREFPNLRNLEVSGLKANIYRNFSTIDVWTGASLVNANIHDNQCSMLQFPSDSEIVNAGLDPALVSAPQCMILTNNDSAIGFDLVAGIGSNINYYNNIYISEPDSNIVDSLRSMIYFYKAPPGGISIYRNTVKVKNIALASPEVQATNKFNFDRITISDNDFDETFLSNQNLIDLVVNRIQSSTLSFKFKRNFTCNNLIKITANDDVNSVVNNFIVQPQNTSGISNCLNVTQSVLDNSANKLSYPANVGVFFGADTLGDADFYMTNIKYAKIINRMNIPDNVSISDFIANSSNNRLVAICRNPEAKFGTFTARLILSN